MCEFFSCFVVSPDLFGDIRFFFTERDSHDTALYRFDDHYGIYLNDHEKGIRQFMRLEIRPPFDTVIVDETIEYPQWLVDNWLEIEHRAIELANRVHAALEAARPVRDAKYALLAHIGTEYRDKCDAIEDRFRQDWRAVSKAHDIIIDPLDTELTDLMSKQWKLERNGGSPKEISAMDAAITELRIKMEPMKNRYSASMETTRRLRYEALEGAKKHHEAVKKEINANFGDPLTDSLRNIEGFLPAKRDM